MFLYSFVRFPLNAICINQVLPNGTKLLNDSNQMEIWNI